MGQTAERRRKRKELGTGKQKLPYLNNKEIIDWKKRKALTEPQGLTKDLVILLLESQRRGDRDQDCKRT